MGVRQYLTAGFISLCLGASIANAKMPTSSLENLLEFECKVTRVVDGDTILVDHDNDPSTRDLYVRLAGIDTPEIKGRKHKQDQYLAQEATQRLNYLIAHEGQGRVTLRVDSDERKQDMYHRLLRDAYVTSESGNEIFLNWKMVREGYAKAKTFGDHRINTGKLKEAQDKAKAEHVGLWDPDRKKQSYAVTDESEKDIEFLRIAGNPNNYFVSHMD